MTLKEVIKKLFEEYDQDSFGVVCRVKSVDVVNLICTCTPLNGDGDFPGVRLKADKTGNGIICIPADNSIVILQPTSQNSGYISMFSQISSIQILDGSRGGLVDVGLLKTQLDKTNKVVNDLKTALTSWTVVPSDGGAALKAAVIAALGIDAVGDFTNISNPNITHGNP